MPFCKFPCAKEIKIIFEVIAAMKSEFYLNFSEEGLVIDGMDLTESVLVKALMKEDGFLQFEKGRIDTTVAGVNAKAMNVFLKTLSRDDFLEFDCHDYGDKMIITTVNKFNVKTKFKMNLLDLIDSHRAVPNIKYRCSVKLSSQRFQNDIRGLLNVSDSVIITVTRDKITLEAVGEESSADVELQKKDTRASDYDMVNITTDESFKAKYSLSLLYKITKATPLSSCITLKFCNRILPMLAIYEMERIGNVSFHVSPRLK
ncbi:Oidioi.mRNA.OKI2018_I69.PAR.g11988.t1.cds [Oikopleura dioica]|uniref:Proliferating cell nuclear antigen n=1 Tax=Oikopleura dioica TaxID=34765 RepID=A0ABN7S315_OIKDI|nr:Oidioi.mRNA.OKI2018_I69.PAR.g11988.t1.cds [Oikopleura dioica]